MGGVAALGSLSSSCSWAPSPVHAGWGLGGKSGRRESLFCNCCAGQFSSLRQAQSIGRMTAVVTELSQQLDRSSSVLKAGSEAERGSTPQTVAMQSDSLWDAGPWLCHPPQAEVGGPRMSQLTDSPASAMGPGLGLILGNQGPVLSLRCQCPQMVINQVQRSHLGG